MITPKGIRRNWHRTYVGLSNTGDLMRTHFVDEAYGDPVVAVAWLDDDDTVKVLAAEYSNGKNAVLRFNKRAVTITMDL